MKPANLLRKPSAWALGLGFLLAMAGCEDRVAGSSVTTGNPTEIQVSFTGENGPVALTGQVEIYAATQIPVPGFRPEPLGRFEVDGKSSFTLNEGHFEGIADSLWATGSLDGDSLARFNLVISATDKGAIVRDLGFRLKDGKFKMKETEWLKGTTEGSAKLATDIKPLVAFEVNVDSSVLGDRRHHYLFLYGTGYSALGENGKFIFATLPTGTYQPAFFSIPTKESQASSPQDSVNVYNLDKPLDPGSNTVGRGAIEIRIPIPAELR